MSRQLNLFGPEEVCGVSSAPAPEPLAQAADLASLPGQLELFFGAHTYERAAEEALLSLDAAALRDLADDADRAYPDGLPADRWRAWAGGVEWLFGEAVSVRERALRAVAVLDGVIAGGRFPGATAGTREALGRAAARGACAALVLAEGPAASLPDGRPAGCLLLDAGDPERALEALAGALGAGRADAATRAAHGRALWRTGRRAEALRAFSEALLLEPAEEVDAPQLEDLAGVAEELELPGDPRAWMPVLADMDGVVPLPSWAGDVTDTPARAFAALLRELRRRRGTGATPEELIAAKRDLLRAAPALRDRVRRL
jgi:tetratricopeptide (TPR) repeat protein